MKREKREKRSEKSRVIKALALTEVFTFIISSFAFAFLFAMMFSLASENVSATGGFGGYYKLGNDYYTTYIDGDTEKVSKWDGSNWIPRDILPDSIRANAETIDSLPDNIRDYFTPEGYTAQESAALVPSNNAPNAGNRPPGEVFTKNFSFLGLGGWSSSSDKVGWIPSQMAEGVTWAAAVLTFSNLVAGFFPDESGQTVKDIGMALSAGIMAYKSTYGLLTQQFGSSSTSSIGNWMAGDTNMVNKWIPCKTTTGCATGASIIVAAAVAYLTYASKHKDTKEKTASIEFKCMPWQAPAYQVKSERTEQCNKCNTNPLMPCSEYRCKALGQTCKLINQGTGQEKCIDSAPDDTNSPGIEPWNGLLGEGYTYYDVHPRPPGQAGVGRMSIIDNSASDKCLKAFTPFEFGIITTDIGDITQPSQCKIDFNHTASFDEMSYWMGDSNLYLENHSQIISMPGTDLLNRLFVGNGTSTRVNVDGEYNLYIRCRDGNNNANEDEFVVNFCIDPAPDTTPPIIKATNPIANSPVLYNIDNMSINVYTNEPSSCRWSRSDGDYDVMENNMSCNNNVWEMNAESLYTCGTTLTGIENNEDNQFYFRCKDLSGNPMRQSYSYVLIGTQPLSILSTSPSGTIGSSTNTATVALEVRTDNGYNNGVADCYYSFTNLSTNYIKMFETGTSISKQSLDLPNGVYTYYFKCVDLGGNAAYNSTTFTVYVDKDSPLVVRAYNLESKLRIVTNEDSTCKYSTTSCNFDMTDEGTIIPYNLPAEHDLLGWKIDQTYYIKCKDTYDNQPLPSECSIIIRPYELSRSA